MITGYNTDVEHDGVVYHVQTEDKGVGTPVILSLVYTGGAVVASKRSRYDDLVTAGFDERNLAERLQRQHKLICAAIHAGRIEDLKRLSQDQPPERPMQGDRRPEPSFSPEEQRVTPTEVPLVQREEGHLLSESRKAGNGLQLSLLEERELRGGEFVTLRVLVSRGSGAKQQALPRVRVLLKTLGTSFRPSSTYATTDNDGVALLFAHIPAFKTGRAAVLVRAEVDGEIAELRRIILPA